MYRRSQKKGLTSSFDHVWGGEFHYWRTPPDAWPEVFRSIRKLGFNTVSTYVPWDFHEITRGRYDFSGRISAARNLTGWLRLARANKMQVILRPGPYIYAEWNFKGPPQRIAKYPRLSEEFLRASRHWIGAVAKAAKPFLASRGGPIIFVQVCNEVTGALEMDNGYADPKFPRIEKIFRKWAQEREVPRAQRHLARIPYHWGGAHLDVPKGCSKEAAELFLAFHDWYTGQYFRRMAHIFRQAGFDVPLCANLVSWHWPLDWQALQRHVDFVGMDTYYPRHLPGNLPAAFTRLYRQFSAVSKFPVAVEFGCGIWDGMQERLGIFDEKHLERTSLLALSQGLQGISYYMLVNRDNWYFAPINEWGKIRDRFAPAIARVGKVVRLLASGEYRPVRSVGLVWHRRDHLDFVLAGKSFDHCELGRQWFEQNSYAADYPEFWSVYQALLEQGYDVEVADADNPDRAWPRVTVFPVTKRWDSNCEELVRRHIRRGGAIVLVGEGADKRALRFPPSIGTPVAKWVQDISWKKLAELPKKVEELGEKPTRVVRGKDTFQFLRVHPAGKQILFVFFLGNKPQDVRIMEGTLRDISTGQIFRKAQTVGLAPKSARVFWLTGRQMP